MTKSQKIEEQFEKLSKSKILIYASESPLDGIEMAYIIITME